VAMGISWMSRQELREAIPPAYTEFIGRQLVDVLATRIQTHAYGPPTPSHTDLPA
jgi:DNA (cytosine-5)-methyltransferase 1